MGDQNPMQALQDAMSAAMTATQALAKAQSEMIEQTKTVSELAGGANNMVLAMLTQLVRNGALSFGQQNEILAARGASTSDPSSR